jgi:hypothetical protein
MERDDILRLGFSKTLCYNEKKKEDAECRDRIGMPAICIRHLHSIRGRRTEHTPISLNQHRIYELSSGSLHSAFPVRSFFRRCYPGSTMSYLQAGRRHHMGADSFRTACPYLLLFPLGLLFQPESDAHDRAPVLPSFPYIDWLMLSS